MEKSQFSSSNYSSNMIIQKSF